MFRQVILFGVLCRAFTGGEKATSYVSVSNPKEGGYSYEVIHDYPSKDSLATVHVYGYDEDYGGKDHVQDYEFGAKLRNYSEEHPKGGVNNHYETEHKFNEPVASSVEGLKNQFLDTIKNVPNFGVVHHTATAPGGIKPTAKTYSSTVVNIKHKSPGSGSQKEVHVKTLKAQSGASYSYDISHSAVTQNSKQVQYKKKKKTDFRVSKANKVSEAFHPSARDPGLSSGYPLKENRGQHETKPQIFHHHHHYQETTTNENNFNGNDQSNFKKPHKLKNLELAFGQVGTSSPGNGGSISVQTSLQHIPHSNLGFSSPNSQHNFHDEEENFDFSPLYDAIQNPKSNSDHFVNNHFSNVQPNDFDSNHPPNDQTINVVDYREFIPNEANDPFPQPPQFANYNQNVGYTYEPPIPSTLNDFDFDSPPKVKSTDRNKKLWKPVFVTSQDDKSKYRTFRISRGFKPGKLVGGFTPSFGLPDQNNRDNHETSHTRAIDDNHFDFPDTETDFHDPSLSYNFNDVFSKLNGDDFPSVKSHSNDIRSTGTKSLKDYHNSVQTGKRKTTGYRRSKASFLGRRPLSVDPIIVPPLRTTTIHSSTSVSTLLPPSAEFSSFRQYPSPLAIHSFEEASSRNARIGSDILSDQATSYANSKGRVLYRSNKTKNQ